MACEARWEQLHNVETALRELEKVGFGPDTEPYKKLWKERGSILARMGRARAKEVIKVGEVSGMSPGILRAWFDTEVGWMVEARATPWADPIYHVVPVEDALAIVQDKVSPELEARLLTPTTYLGEE